jgi:nitrite reductase/ring-hydroxylating ferredoxin subunit
MFQPTIPLSELPAGKMKKFLIGEKQILLTNVNGEIHATDNICTHANSELSDGRLEGCIVECAMHGGMFDVRDGNAQGLPAVMPLKTYPAKIENEVIHIDIDA